MLCVGPLRILTTVEDEEHGHARKDGDDGKPADPGDGVQVLIHDDVRGNDVWLFGGWDGLCYRGWRGWLG
jgi:hypothetical protein